MKSSVACAISLYVNSKKNHCDFVEFSMKFFLNLNGISIFHPGLFPPQYYLQEIPLIKGFPTISRPQWGMPWFGKSQHYKQNKQTQPYLIDRYQIKCLLLLAFKALSSKLLNNLCKCD
jgi:hypothetical protein